MEDTNFLNDTGSQNIIDYSKLGDKPSDLVASLLGLDPSDVHKVLTEAYGENFDRYNSHNLHSVSDINNFMRSIDLLKPWIALKIHFRILLLKSFLLASP